MVGLMALLIASQKRKHSHQYYAKIYHHCTCTNELRYYEQSQAIYA